MIDDDIGAQLRDRALLELLYSSGARISEVVGLDVDDVDADERTVLLDGKGGKQRIVPVGRPALQLPTSARRNGPDPATAGVLSG